MEKVLISKVVNNKLQDLIQILFYEEYFGFEEQSSEYVSKIYEHINTIPHLKHRRTENRRYGQYYVIYRVNKKTCYYITFNKKNSIYFIENIFTNHTKEYVEFILKK